MANHNNKKKKKAGVYKMPHSSQPSLRKMKEPRKPWVDPSFDWSIQCYYCSKSFTPQHPNFITECCKKNMGATCHERALLEDNRCGYCREKKKRMPLPSVDYEEPQYIRRFQDRDKSESSTITNQKTVKVPTTAGAAAPTAVVSSADIDNLMDLADQKLSNGIAKSNVPTNWLSITENKDAKGSEIGSDNSNMDPQKTSISETREKAEPPHSDQSHHDQLNRYVSAISLSSTINLPMVSATTMADLQELLPDLEHEETIFNPAEVNSQVLPNQQTLSEAILPSAHEPLPSDSAEKTSQVTLTTEYSSASEAKETRGSRTSRRLNKDASPEQKVMSDFHRFCRTWKHESKEMDDDTYIRVRRTISRKLVDLIREIENIDGFSYHTEDKRTDDDQWSVKANSSEKVEGMERK